MILTQTIGEERSHTPADCALAIGFPTTAAELIDDCADPGREFGRTIVVPQFAKDGLCPMQAWNGGYGHAIQNLQQVLDEVAAPCPGKPDSRGTTVVKGATAADVASLLRKFPVVTIVAHSPFPLLSPASLFDRKALLETLVGPQAVGETHPVIDSLRADSGVRECATIQELVARLNELLHESMRYYTQPLEPGDTFSSLDDVPALDRLTMARLYAAMPKAFKPPPVLELSDGSCDFEKLVAAVPRDRSPVLDLGACRALWFMGDLRLRCRGCGDILGPWQRTYSNERFLIYRHVIRLLHLQPMPYPTAVRSIHAIARQWAEENAVLRCSAATPHLGALQ